METQEKVWKNKKCFLWEHKPIGECFHRFFRVLPDLYKCFNLKLIKTQQKIQNCLQNSLKKISNNVTMTIFTQSACIFRFTGLFLKRDCKNHYCYMLTELKMQTQTSAKTLKIAFSDLKYHLVWDPALRTYLHANL